MTCRPIKNNKGEVTGFICVSDWYRYKHNGRDFLFENSYHGPWPLRKNDYAPWARVTKAFWRMWEEFSALPKDEQERYRL